MWSLLQIWRVEADTPIAYYLLHLISSLFWPAHISRNNKHCLKSKCGVSWDVSWVLRCGGQTCRRGVWRYLEITILGGGDDQLEICANLTCLLLTSLHLALHKSSCSLHSEHISSIIPYMSGAGAGWGNQAAIMVHQNFILYCNKWLGNSLFILNKNSCRQRIALCKVPMITKKENLHCLKAATNIKLRPHDC